MKTYVFDVDGVLCDINCNINPEFRDWFIDWSKDKEYYIVTGGERQSTINQVGIEIVNNAKTQFHCMGNHVFIEGREYKLNQFTSTTIDVNVATNYTEKGEWNDEPDDITQTQEYCCLLQILALKGTRLLYNNSVSNFLKDHEVNINIDSRYLIKGNTKLYLDNGIYYTTDIVIV